MFRLLLAVLLFEALSGAESSLCQALRSGDPSLGSASATCQQSQLATGVDQRVCHWSFPSGEGQGASLFDEVSGLINRCLPGIATLPPEPGVNHPDSYHQQIYEGAGWRISLSLKQKGALGRTFVFLGISPLP